MKPEWERKPLTWRDREDVIRLEARDIVALDHIQFDSEEILSTLLDSISVYHSRRQKQLEKYLLRYGRLRLEINTGEIYYYRLNGAFLSLQFLSKWIRYSISVVEISQSKDRTIKLLLFSLWTKKGSILHCDLWTEVDVIYRWVAYLVRSIIGWDRENLKTCELYFVPQNKWGELPCLKTAR